MSVKLESRPARANAGRRRNAPCARPATSQSARNLAVIELTASAAAEAGRTPIPMTDAAPLAALLATMIDVLCALHGRRLAQGEAHILARTGLAAQGDALLFAALGRTRPGLGAVLGSPEAADSVRAVGLALCDVLASGAAPAGGVLAPLVRTRDLARRRARSH